MILLLTRQGTSVFVNIRNINYITTNKHDQAIIRMVDGTTLVVRESMSTVHQRIEQHIEGKRK